MLNPDCTESEIIIWKRIFLTLIIAVAVFVLFITFIAPQPEVFKTEQAEVLKVENSTVTLTNRKLFTVNSDFSNRLVSGDKVSIKYINNYIASDTVEICLVGYDYCTKSKL